MEYTAKKINWESDGGINMFRWDVFKGSLLVGRIYPSECKAKFAVHLEKNFKPRYVQKFETAINHIERETKNIYSLQEAVKIFNQ